MTGFKLSVVVFFLSFLWTFSRGDVEHFCDVGQPCVLPCTFEVADEVVIHWILLGNIQAHSFYHNKDQFGLQDQRFKGRTSLFKEQISSGNASLQLTAVKVQDEGRYKCYTSTIRKNKESFINLKVDAPVHQVNIQQVEDRITCSSEGIYPEPGLTWSTRPPSSMNVQNPNTVQQTEQQLYNISGSLMVSDSHTDLVYSCTVSTRRNKRTASLTTTTCSSGSSSETKLTCSTSNTPLTGFIWRFNHSQIIVTRRATGGSSLVSEEWRRQVKEVSESGDITLQDLSSDQEGLYTCEPSNAEETSSTFLKITGVERTNVAAIVVGVLVSVLVLVFAVSVYVIYHRRRKSNQRRPVATQEPRTQDMESACKMDSLRDS